MLRVEPWTAWNENDQKYLEILEKSNRGAVRVNYDHLMELRRKKKRHEDGLPPLPEPWYLDSDNLNIPDLKRWKKICKKRYEYDHDYVDVYGSMCESEYKRVRKNIRKAIKKLESKDTNKEEQELKSKDTNKEEQKSHCSDCNKKYIVSALIDGKNYCLKCAPKHEKPIQIWENEEEELKPKADVIRRFFQRK